MTSIHSADSLVMTERTASEFPLVARLPGSEVTTMPIDSSPHHASMARVAARDGVVPASIAIVGAGPAGCYAAQALRKALGAAQITVIDRLPVPFGLLRYGVAADHQGTKAVQHQFERLFQHTDVAFVGGLELGRDLHLDELTEHFDVVVLATGLPRDRRLGIEDAAGNHVIGAGRLTRALNSHPEACASLPVVLPRVAIVGSGNVAVDLLRVLSKRSDEWDGSDMDDAILRRVIPRPVREIHLISRAGAAQARWDAPMLRALGSLHRPTFHLSTGGVEAGLSPAADALLGLFGTTGTSGDLTVHFHLECVVEQPLGYGIRRGLRIRHRAGTCKLLAIDTVLTAIGFEPDAGGVLPPRVYPTGWLRTGARGGLTAQRTLARQLAGEIAMDLSSGRIASGRPGRSTLPCRRTTDFSGWRSIDAFERTRAPAHRIRRKITDTRSMYAIAARERKAVTVEEDAGS